MLFKSFLNLLLIGITIQLCNGQCFNTIGDANTKWRAADLLEKLGHDFYQSLALGPLDAKDSEKRFVSVFGHAIYEYLISRSLNERDRIREAVNKTKSKLKQPAEVLAGPMRAVISMMFNVVELPSTDIQQACPYTVCQADCEKALAQIQAKKIKTCPGYKINIAVYNTAINFVTSCGLLKELGGLLTTCKGSDNDALDFFSVTASKKYPLAIQTFKKVFDQMNNIPPTMHCNMFSFL